MQLRNAFDTVLRPAGGERDWSDTGAGAAKAPAGVNVRARYNRLANLYDAVDMAELLYKRRVRPHLFAGLSGRILDAGVGTGCSIPFYPDGAWTLGMDLSPGMLGHARRRARRLNRSVSLAAMDIMSTGFADASFDAVVSAFTFCTLDESRQRPALAEMARILKPGGELRILDYAFSRHLPVRLAMRAWQVWEQAVLDLPSSHCPQQLLLLAVACQIQEQHPEP